jgi:hypothetical protein
LLALYPLISVINAPFDLFVNFQLFSIPLHIGSPSQCEEILQDLIGGCIFDFGVFVVSFGYVAVDGRMA